ncbi:MAG: STAS domain-containing protein [Armatimonadota bacterium]
MEPQSADIEPDGVDVETADEPQIIRQTRTDHGVTVVEAQGEIDLATTPQLSSALYEAAITSPYVIVDLSAVTYMDSSGFGALLGATKKLRPDGGTLYLVGCSPNIERMLVITRLNTIFSIHSTEAEARSAIAASKAGQGGSETIVAD